MSSYPRVKDFDFEIDRVIEIPAWQTGRLDLIALEIYGDTRYYKALAQANDIRVRGGYRAGIRTNEEALASELQRKGVPLEDIPAIVSEKILTSRPNELDWDGYNNISYGYISDAYETKGIAVPTPESANAFLDRFEFIVLDGTEENN